MSKQFRVLVLIVLFGFLPSVQAQGQRQVAVRSTAYCLRGRTCRGLPAGYGTVAVDPRVIRLGSKLYIPGYGDAVAADTGGAVRGNVIDVWFPTVKRCSQWGNRRVLVTVVEN